MLQQIAYIFWSDNAISPALHCSSGGRDGVCSPATAMSQPASSTSLTGRLCLQDACPSTVSHWTAASRWSEPFSTVPTHMSLPYTSLSGSSISLPPHSKWQVQYLSISTHPSLPPIPSLSIHSEDMLSWVDALSSHLKLKAEASPYPPSSHSGPHIQV